LTNDSHPPHGLLNPILVKTFAQIGAGSVILPGVRVNSNSLAGAGSLVTKDVGDFRVVMGSPARDYSVIREIKDLNGEKLYPWKEFLTSKRGFPWER
jgi:acetyltransferase-like isoleucine patch superfamily enzyme